MIMLPSHGQDTAALQQLSGQARLIILSNRHVFDKQAKTDYLPSSFYITTLLYTSILI